MNRSIKSVVFVLVFTSLVASSYGMDRHYFPPIVSQRGTELSVPMLDIESQVARKEGHCRAIAACFADCAHSVKEAVKSCWYKLPRGGKDAVELAGLASVDVAMCFYGNASENTYLPLLVSYAVGQASSEITDRHKYYAKVLASATVVGLIELLKMYSGFNLWTFTMSALMAVVHATFEEYAKMSGRKNTFSEDFRDLPADLQTMVVERIKRLAVQVRAIKRDKHDMPLVEVGPSMATAGVRIADMV